MIAPALEAWQADRKLWALVGPITVPAIVTGSGETIYRLPAGATVIKPPGDTPAGKVPVFLDRVGKWVLVSDHRGETWFDLSGQPEVISRLGNPAEWGYRREAS